VPYRLVRWSMVIIGLSFQTGNRCVCFVTNLVWRAALRAGRALACPAMSRT